MRIGLMLGVGASLVAASAAAQTVLETSQAVYVERLETATGGRAVRALEPAQELRRGDKVVLMVEWHAQQMKRSLTIASEVPPTLAFQRSSEESLEVSVDGGRKWGRLGRMQVLDGGGMRLASPEDVTHLRWRIPAGKAERSRNRITYSAIVR